MAPNFSKSVSLAIFCGKTSLVAAFRADGARYAVVEEVVADCGRGTYHL